MLITTQICHKIKLLLSLTIVCISILLHIPVLKMLPYGLKLLIIDLFLFFCNFICVYDLSQLTFPFCGPFPSDFPLFKLFETI